MGPSIRSSLGMLFLATLIMFLFLAIVLGFTLGFTHPLPWILILSLAVFPYLYDKFFSLRHVKWNKSMSVGVEIIDKEHKVLLGIINQLQQSTQYKVDDEAVENSLKELIDYTNYHFSREEELMRINNYPGYEAHKKSHEEMVSIIVKFIEEYQVDNIHTIDQVLLFLQAWLINHINGSDKKYAPYLNIKEIGDAQEKLEK